MNFIVPYVIYPFEVMFSFGQTDKEVYAALKNQGINKRDTIYKYNGDEAKTIHYENGFTLIRLKYIPDDPAVFADLQHEIFHAVYYLMEHVGVELTSESQENYAYVIGYLTKESHKKIFEANKSKPNE